MSSKPILSGIKLTKEITELRERVLTYKPGGVSTCPDPVDFPEKLYIGLYGNAGCGKTSLINSLKFAAHGKLGQAQWLPTAPQEKAGGHTMYRRLADISMKIFVIDNRGLDISNHDEKLVIAELAAQLDGKRGYSEMVEWQRATDENDTDDENEDMDLNGLDLKIGHPISCALLVFSARHDINLNSIGQAEVIAFLYSQRGRYPVAIITHVDVAELKRVEELKAFLRGFGVTDIVEVANLTTEKKLLEEPYQHSLLSLLERCMTDGEETIIFRHYRRKERKEIERRLEEKIRKQEDERRAEERRQMAEEERTQRENQMRTELEEQRRAIERERERVNKLEIKAAKKCIIM